jgi:Spy/CpxP family protein refolding chaperone
MSTVRTVLFAAGFMTLGALGATAGSALARPGGHHDGPPAMKLGHLIASLDLTEAQEAALLDLREDLASEFKTSRSDHKDEMESIVSAIKSDTVDREAVHALIDAAAAERTAMAHRATDGVLDIYDTLSPEQKTLLIERLDDAKSRHAELRERHEAHRARRDAQD